jgi:hypothetical protein
MMPRLLWLGVEQGHLGKTEIFCAFNPASQEAVDAVDAWRSEQKDRAVKERYFAETMDSSEEVSRDLCIICLVEQNS